MRIHAAIALIGALCTGVVLAQDGNLETASSGNLSGRAKVIDGDSFRLGRIEVRLYGIDAVESEQNCLRPSSRHWGCGRAASRALRLLVGGQIVTCVHHGVDDNGRALATCSVPSGSINEWLVRQGWAVAYRRHTNAYIEAEAEARAALLNIWSGRFTEPERYRDQKRN